MEAALLLGILGYGMHQYMDHNDDKQTTEYVYSSTQTTKNISQFHKDVERAAMMSQVDWSKPGNFVVGDSPETGVQWVFVTGN